MKYRLLIGTMRDFPQVNDCGELARYVSEAERHRLGVLPFELPDGTLLEFAIMYGRGLAFDAGFSCEDCLSLLQCEVSRDNWQTAGKPREKFYLPPIDGRVITLTRMAQFLKDMQNLAYVDGFGNVDPNKDHVGSEFIDDVLALLREYNLAPVTEPYK